MFYYIPAIIITGILWLAVFVQVVVNHDEINHLKKELKQHESNN